MLFGNDNEGRMTFGDDTYLYSTSGISEQGLRRAEEKAHWMNAHLLAEITKARQAALEEAAQFIETHKAAWSKAGHIVIDFPDTDAEQRVIAKSIRALKTGVGLHASQQPHAGDGETTRA